MNTFRIICLAFLGFSLPLTGVAQHFERPAIVLKPDVLKAFSSDFTTQVATALQYRWAELNPSSPPPLFYVGTYPPVKADYPELIFVHLTGHCDVLPQVALPHVSRPLGTVQFVDGESSNHLNIDCAEIAYAINAQIRSLKPPERSEAMARAISRVFQHEYLHFRLNSTRHHEAGIFAPELSANFLVAPEKKIETQSTFVPPLINLGS